MGLTLGDFELGVVRNMPFHHRDHVRLAYEILTRDPFDVAVARFTSGLRRIAAGAGDPTKVHMTITVAFLAAIAERHARHPADTWEQFAARNPDVLEKGFLERWYSRGELDSDLARRTFLLPSSG